MDNPADFVDLERYPITSLESPRGRALIADIRKRMTEGCICTLPGFLRPEALARMVEEAEAIESLAYQGPTEATPYFFNYGTAEELNALPDNHPKRTRTRRNLRQIAYDLIPSTAAIRQLYHWDGLARFLAAATGVETLYRSADPYQALNISVMDEDGCQQWHFDTNEVAITLLLQAPEA